MKAGGVLSEWTLSRVLDYQFPGISRCGEKEIWAEQEEQLGKGNIEFGQGCFFLRGKPLLSEGTRTIDYLITD